MKVIGVIDAGVRAALNVFEKDEDGSVGVMATAGTVASGGHATTLDEQRTAMHFSGDIDVFQEKLDALYAYQENGEYVYRPFLSKHIELIDPALNTAMELYAKVIQRLSDKVPLIYELMKVFNHKNSKTGFLQEDERF